MIRINSALKILLGLFLILNLRHQPVAQVQDSVFNAPLQSEQTPLKKQPETSQNLKADEEKPEEKANPKLIAAVCLFIITTTLLLYHVRSK